ncbi:Serine phosphatase RsbU regulator of sigma subunit / Serine-protein kinase RsbW [Paramagnetospirillum magnetotacticum MS-1]|uniref:Serine phosphatase RsbU regulator of sigma subunit / Serine-protein kinase RsbW n=1 Tax=Paramagnetospirillum magnetotacticum MS-1 TaxID=272627 RepID=A0A0C2YW44_PARME|nr:SpoIIE family protein phosphatase [Paramagnetospirillum magnetotacticum]KIL99338.1 Serine phosphatase RsbU regulator of sigma subunit / Serine-protein kinase RsbW [Paramagnetospirillum magnetotacticum MS-1]
MLLRTRVTLIVTFTYSLLVAGLFFAGVKNEDLADERYVQATLNGQQIFWDKLVENTVQRLEAVAPLLAANQEMISAIARKSPSEAREAMAPTIAGLSRRGVARVEIVGLDGDLLYSSQGSLLETPLVDAGTVRLIAETGKARTGVTQNSDKQFIAAITVPLVSLDKMVTGVATMVSDLRPPLEEFKASTGSDVFLVDRAGHMTDGTNDLLWRVFESKISVRKSRLETWRDGSRFYSVVVFPLSDGESRVIGALVSVRDSTDTQARQHEVRVIAIGAVGLFLVLVLVVFSVYLRRSFDPLDQAIAVLNALSRGDTSVMLDVRHDNDEIGRIASTVGVFRENAIKIDMLEERRERQRRRQELFIRLQMLRLSEMLEQDAREAVLDDLRQIEELSSRSTAGDEGSDGAKGELDVLAVAFQTMSSRIREQHERLESLITERTRDVEILREALRTRDQLAALRQELDFARELQLSSLPQVFPPFPDRGEFQIHASMVPAKEVGGDFYDFFFIDHHNLGFVIGDASGKGVPAAMFIAITRSLVKAVAPLSSSPGECLAFVNTMLARDNPQTLFATCFYGVLDTRSGEVSFCNAGHPPPMILRSDGRVEAIRDVSGVALGVMEDLEYETGCFVLEPGEVVHLYTDGVTEAQDSVDALYDEPRLIAELGRTEDRAPEAVIASVLRSVEAFVGNAPQFDDITMLTLRFDQASIVSDAPLEDRPRLMLTGFPATGGNDMDGKASAEPVQDAVPTPAPHVVQPVLMEPDRVGMVIGNDVGELERLAELVDSFIEKHRLPEKLAFNLNVCLDELITNIISYGYDDEDHHEILVEFVYDGREFVTSIIDDAKEYNPFIEAPIPDLDLDVDDRPIGGLGVFLVKEFMDGTEYVHEAGRNTTTLRKTISA